MNPHHVLAVVGLGAAVACGSSSKESSDGGLGSGVQTDSAVASGSGSGGSSGGPGSSGSGSGAGGSGSGGDDASGEGSTDAGGGTGPVGDASPPPATQIVAGFADTQQTMDGFGAAEAFIPTITAAQADLFFSTTSGIGLSMLRLGIAPDGTLYSGSWGTAQMALARNASLTVWGAPWSPPTSAKTTGNTTTGSILPADYGSWASTLAAFVTAGRKNNVPVAFISAQNEPDYNTNGAYDMCLYDQNQMTSFIKALGPALAGLNPAAGIIMPEPSSWGNLYGGTNYVGTAMADSTAAGFINVIASHQYSQSDPPSHAVPAGKRMWETEVSDFGTFDASIGNAVLVATWIHNAIIDGGVNAWHYWWLVNQNADNEGLVGKNGDATLTKRVYAMGNFSRFIRPGWVRIGTTGTVSGLLVSAYKAATTGDFAIVAINTTSASVTATFGITGPVFSSVAAYVTSGTAVGNIGTDGNLSQGSTSGSIPMSITASMNAFSASVPVGVETFVGTAH